MSLCLYLYLAISIKGVKRVEASQPREFFNRKLKSQRTNESEICNNTNLRLNTYDNATRGSQMNCKVRSPKTEF